MERRTFLGALGAGLAALAAPLSLRAKEDRVAAPATADEAGLIVLAFRRGVPANLQQVWDQSQLYRYAVNGMTPDDERRVTRGEARLMGNVYAYAWVRDSDAVDHAEASFHHSPAFYGKVRVEFSVQSGHAHLCPCEASKFVYNLARGEFEPTA